MIKPSYKRFYIVCIAIFYTLLFSNSRVAFSRPGSVIRTPGAVEHESFNQYIVGFAGELTHYADLNYASAAYFKSVLADKYHFGITYNTHNNQHTTETTPPSFLSFHVHKQIFKRNNIGINFGIHDVMYSSKKPHRISLFTLFSHLQNINSKYQLETTFGFGTGYINFDSHDYNNSPTKSNNEFFLGLKLNTPMMAKNGGAKFAIEYDGWGLNLGVMLPVSYAWTINLGITHFENLARFNDWNNNEIFPDAPALALGFQMNIPKLKYKKIKSSIDGLNTIYNQLPYDESLDSLVRHATVLVNSLEDSLLFKKQETINLNIANQALNQQINMLEDSLRHMQLDMVISEVNLNKAMKYLSNSLNLYYTQNYNLALEETDKAIHIYPNLAISYARKGSIYYKLQDKKRATINWNIALKLDPEYKEVRDVLIQLKENSSIKILPE